MSVLQWGMKTTFKSTFSGLENSYKYQQHVSLRWKLVFLTCSYSSLLPLTSCPGFSHFHQESVDVTSINTYSHSTLYTSWTFCHFLSCESSTRSPEPFLIRACSAGEFRLHSWHFTALLNLLVNQLANNSSFIYIAVFQANKIKVIVIYKWPMYTETYRI